MCTDKPGVLVAEGVDRQDFPQVVRCSWTTRARLEQRLILSFAAVNCTPRRPSMCTDKPGVHYYSWEWRVADLRCTMPHVIGEYRNWNHEQRKTLAILIYSEFIREYIGARCPQKTE